MCSGRKTCGTSTVNSPCGACGGKKMVWIQLDRDSRGKVPCPDCYGVGSERIQVTLCGRRL